MLDLVARFIKDIKRVLPLLIEVDNRWLGRFPRTKILRSDAHELILKMVADYIYNIGFSGFLVARQLEEIRKAVCRYITKLDFTAEEIA